MNQNSLSRLVPENSINTELDQIDQLKREMEENFHLYQEVKALPPSDQDALFKILWEAQNGDPSALEAINELVYDETPVSIDEFILGRRYLNLDGLINRRKLEIMEYFAKPSLRKMYIAAGSGGGKSFLVSLAMSWMVYSLLCLKRPDMFYMLGPRSKLALINLSVGKEQAKDVIFSEFLARLEHSNYFSEGKNYKKWTAKARFLKNVFVFSGGSGVVSFFGYHTIMGSLDEASHMLDKSDGRSLAEELSEALLKSLNTRFPNAYKLFVISTLRSPDDFLNTRIEQIKEDGIALVNEPIIV